MAVLEGVKSLQINQSQKEHHPVTTRLQQAYRKHSQYSRTHNAGQMSRLNNSSDSIIKIQFSGKKAMMQTVATTAEVERQTESYNTSKEKNF